MARQQTLVVEVRMRHVWLVPVAAWFRSFRLAKWAVERVTVETRTPGKPWKRAGNLKVNRD